MENHNQVEPRRKIISLMVIFGLTLGGSLDAKSMERVYAPESTIREFESTRTRPYIVPETVDDSGRTALMNAAASGDYLLARDLIESGASLYAQDENGFTPITYA